ncbi:penicillin-insensitive murein endopeptidase [Bosea caraganae]|uniref:Penicillin-insensitive murein endopeptidase n=1 Tax=Bosea caraganae TaxID=2763117 RepID=A0A370L7I8_9HYPH|nr:penicillin-insensitive murein endopeptidase [Bosea caraganae]RDJ25029.1 penicillin-insensitive murein endopeptidase [Bosea caraganae]RDJ26139.1 penicillin-insensitive murein endopeptidase [Bosea caraganae]
MPRSHRRFVLAATLLAAAFAPCLARAQDTASEEAKRRATNLAAYPEAARALFGQKTTPAHMPPESIGSYARGCLAGGAALPVDGDAWQVMRLNRNRNWGHPELIAFLERLARNVPKINGWPGLLVGDMSQARGGPMLTGHASHQIGLDADVWLTPMPRDRIGRDERENMPAVNMARSDWRDVDPKNWTPAHTRLIRAVAAEPRVERIFVNPALKVALCRESGSERDWLKKVRPIWGHNYHFHIRLSCPVGMASCAGQEPPNFGDGCGEELSGWIQRQHEAIFNPPKPKPGPKPKPKPPMSLEALPPECRQVLNAR